MIGGGIAGGLVRTQQRTTVRWRIRNYSDVRSLPFGVVTTIYRKMTPDFAINQTIAFAQSSAMQLKRPVTDHLSRLLLHYLRHDGGGRSIA
jgi:hypothetical protein